MSLTFTTTIKSMYTIPNPTGYVVNVLWTETGTDGTHTASIDGNSQFTPTQGQTIVPYAQLTQAEVIGWIPPDQIASAQANIQGQIQSMITPPVSPSNTALPWA
jgi:hypothetical protein